MFDDLIDQELRDRQELLVRTLTAGGPPPTGFEPKRFEAAARSLARKRAREVARAWPGLSSALGDTFGVRFAEYASQTPRPSQGGPLADGHRFSRWLGQDGRLTDATRLERLAVDLRFRVTRDGLHPRRWPLVRVTRLRQARSLVVALRWPGIGVHQFAIVLAPHLGKVLARSGWPPSR